MTTRRSFFRSLALLTGAASVSPLVFVPKFEPVRWKVVHLVRGPAIVDDGVLQCYVGRGFWESYFARLSEWRADWLFKQEKNFTFTVDKTSYTV